MTEAEIQSAIRLAVGTLPHVRLFRNNRGVAWMGKIVSRRDGLLVLANARPVEFGLTNGASDLIGPVQMTITDSDVGRTVALFGAAEVKRPGENVPEHQQRFVDFVSDFGGVAGVVRSPDDAVLLVSGGPTASRIARSRAAFSRATGIPGL